MMLEPRHPTISCFDGGLSAPEGFVNKSLDGELRVTVLFLLRT